MWKENEITNRHEVQMVHVDSLVKVKINNLSGFPLKTLIEYDDFEFTIQIQAKDWPSTIWDPDQESSEPVKPEILEFLRAYSHYFLKDLEKWEYFRKRAETQYAEYVIQMLLARLKGDRIMAEQLEKIIEENYHPNLHENMKEEG